jgi:hypothetical protein
VWLLYALAALQFSFAAFFDPSRSALVPSIARPHELVTANALMAMTWSAMLAVGAAVGGVISGLLGPSTAFILDAVSFVASAALLVGLGRPRPARDTARTASAAAPGTAVPAPPARTGDAAGGTTDGAAARGLFALLGAQPRLRALLLIKAGVCATGGAMWLLSVVFGQRAFPLGKEGAISVGLLYGAQGLGAVLGANLSTRLFTGAGGEAAERRTVRIVLVTFAVRALLFGLLGLAPHIAWAMGTLVGLSACGSLLWVISTTMVQRLAPDALLGRVFALELAALTLTFCGALFGAGRALDVRGLSPQSTAFVAALVGAGVTLLWTLALLCWPGWLRGAPAARGR